MLYSDLIHKSRMILVSVIFHTVLVIACVACVREKDMKRVRVCDRVCVSVCASIYILMERVCVCD